jgi:hypothetical protein
MNKMKKGLTTLLAALSLASNPVLFRDANAQTIHSNHLYEMNVNHGLSEQDYWDISNMVMQLGNTIQRQGEQPLYVFDSVLEQLPYDILNRNSENPKSNIKLTYDPTTWDLSCQITNPDGTSIHYGGHTHRLRDVTISIPNGILDAGSYTVRVSDPSGDGENIRRHVGDYAACLSAGRWELDKLVNR